MAIPASNVGVEPRTILNSTAAELARGVRVTVGASGTCTVAGLAVRGDFVTNQVIPISVASATPKAGLGYSTSGGGQVPALASEAVAVGDDAFSAADGKFSKTSTSAVYMGRWVIAASADGVLGAVELGVVE